MDSIEIPDDWAQALARLAEAQAPEPEPAQVDVDEIQDRLRRLADVQA